MLKEMAFRFIALMLVCILLPCQPGWSAGEASSGDILVNIDQNMTLTDNKDGTWNWKGGTEDTVRHIDWQGQMDRRGLTADGSALELHQTKTSAYNQRLVLASPASVPLTEKTAVAVRFKLGADSYSGNLPFVKVRFVWASIYLEMTSFLSLTEKTADTWQTLMYTLDPATHTITGTLDGKTVASTAYDASKTDLGGASFQLVAQNESAPESPSETDVLNTPLSWSFDWFRVLTGDSADPVTPPAAEELLIDDNMALSGEFLSQTGTIQHAFFPADNPGITIEGFTRDLAEGNTQFRVKQNVSTDYKQRLIITDPPSFHLDDKVTVSCKFKLSAGDYNVALPDASMRLVWRGDPTDAAEGWNDIYLDMSGKIPLSSDTQEIWQTVSYTVDPSTHKVTCYLNGKLAGSASYAEGKQLLSNLCLQSIVQPSGKKNSEWEELTTPVTWTYDSFQIVKGGGSEPEPPQTGDLVKIDDEMQLSGDMLSQIGTIQHHYYNAGTDKKFSRTLNDEKTQFVVSQGLSSAYQQRLMIASPDPITLDDTVTVTCKFKIKAEDYTKEPFARMTLAWLGLNNYFLKMADPIPLTAETADLWQTITCTIDPKTNTIIQKLNGEQVAKGSFPAGTKEISKLGLFPVVQAKGSNGETDAQDLLTQVTWTYDLIQVTKGSGEPEPPTPEAEPLEHSVSIGAWKSPAYPDGVGDNETAQLTGTKADLGKLAQINKVEIDHDPAKVMSFSVSASSDGLTYTPITDVYPGGLDAYSGKQTYRFPPTTARFVKYNTVLVEDSETQGVLNNMTISYADTTAIRLEQVPDSINPLEVNELPLRAEAEDSGGGRYSLNHQGVKWIIEGETPAGISLNGTLLSISPEAANGTVVLKASDRSNDVSQTKSIRIESKIAVRNFALYADEMFQTPLESLTAGETVSVKADLLTNQQSAETPVRLMIAAYDDTGIMLSSNVTDQSAPANTATTVAAATLTLPADLPDGSTVRAYLWQSDSLAPLLPSIGCGDSGSLNVQNLFLPVNGERVLRCPVEDITWKSSDAAVAEIDSSGKVKGKGEGFAVITASKNGTVIASTQVQVKAGAYVYLLMGQSNMSGTNNPVAENVDVSISDNVTLLNNNGVFEPAQHPYRRYSGVNYIGGNNPDDTPIGWSDAQSAVGPQYGINAGYQFAENMAQAHPDKKIGLVVNSSSGCNIITYEKGAEQTVPLANGFVNTVSRMRQALSGDAVFKGILWHQGESDQRDNTYPQHFRNLIYDLRTALDAPEVPVLAGGLSETQRSTAGHNSRVRAEQNNIPNMVFVSSTEPAPIISRAETAAYQNDPAIWQKDYTHFSAAGQIEFGNRYYRAYLDFESGIE